MDERKRKMSRAWRGAENKYEEFTGFFGIYLA
jgi:hypothetical protein